MEKVWELMKQLKLEDLAAKMVKGTSFVSGAAQQIGAVVKIEYNDDAVWELRVSEISERTSTIGYEVLSTEPALDCTSIMVGSLALETPISLSAHLCWCCTPRGSFSEYLDSDWLQGEIQLTAVTSSDETFIRWTTVYSNDVSLERIQDQKFKKLEFFKAAQESL